MNGPCKRPGNQKGPRGSRFDFHIGGREGFEPDSDTFSDQQVTDSEDKLVPGDPQKTHSCHWSGERRNHADNKTQEFIHRCLPFYPDESPGYPGAKSAARMNGIPPNTTTKYPSPSALTTPLLCTVTGGITAGDSCIAGYPIEQAAISIAMLTCVMTFPMVLLPLA